MPQRSVSPSVTCLMSSVLFSWVSITTVELRRLRGDLIQVFKIVHGYDRLSFIEFFTFSHISQAGEITASNFKGGTVGWVSVLIVLYCMVSVSWDVGGACVAHADHFGFTRM